MMFLVPLVILLVRDIPRLIRIVQRLVHRRRIRHRTAKRIAHYQLITKWKHDVLACAKMNLKLLWFWWKREGTSFWWTSQNCRLLLESVRVLLIVGHHPRSLAWSASSYSLLVDRWSLALMSDPYCICVIANVTNYFSKFLYANIHNMTSLFVFSYMLFW